MRSTTIKPRRCGERNSGVSVLRRAAASTVSALFEQNGPHKYAVAADHRESWGRRGVAFNRRHLAATIRLRTLVCGLIALLTSISPASAGIDIFNIAGEPLTISGWMRTREYAWSYFNPGAPANGQSENLYNYQANVFRLGFGYQLDDVKIFAELMNSSAFDLPNQAFPHSRQIFRCPWNRRQLLFHWTP